MQPETKIDRRGFLSLIGVGAAGFLGTLASGRFPRLLSSVPAGSSDEPDLEIALNATNSQMPLLAGKATDVLTYEGTVLAGDPARLEKLEGTYLGPIIRARTGERIRVHFTNHLTEETVVHWHGLHVPESMDGHPRFAIRAGESYVYEFEVMGRAGPYWFHPRFCTKTGPHRQSSAGSDDGDLCHSPAIKVRTFAMRSSKEFDTATGLRYKSSPPGLLVA